MTENLGSIKFSHLDRFINAIGHPPAKRQFSAIAVISAELLDQELQNAPIAGDHGCTLVVSCTPTQSDLHLNLCQRATGSLNHSMRTALRTWIRAADALRHLTYFHLGQPSLDLEYVRIRAGDYYISLVGELFDRLQQEDGVDVDWAYLGNALAQFAIEGDLLFPSSLGISKGDAAFCAAAVFYFGGSPASAYLTIQSQPLVGLNNTALACFTLPSPR